jgi:hypothetical protein
MPSALHEESFDYLKDCFTLAIGRLPYNDELLTPRASMNSNLKIEDKIVTPDMLIQITPVKGPRKMRLISGVGECALSESKEDVFDKVEDEIRAHPEIDLAIVVVVTEAIPYASPAKDSTAWKALCNSKEEHSLSLDSFIDQRSTPRSVGHPLKVAGHNWCHLDTVEYFAWVKGEDGLPIDIRNENPGYMAHGVSFPFHSAAECV